MPDESKKPDPMADLRAGLGLLFRAAKTAVDEFPTEKIEEAVKQGARDVGRALETVGEAIDEKVLGNKKKASPPATGESAPAPGENAAAQSAAGTEGSSSSSSSSASSTAPTSASTSASTSGHGDGEPPKA